LGLEIGRQHEYSDKAKNWMKILHEGIVPAVMLGSIGQGSLAEHRGNFLHKRCLIPKNPFINFKVTQARRPVEHFYRPTADSFSSSPLYPESMNLDLIVLPDTFAICRLDTVLGWKPIGVKTINSLPTMKR
jgi:hypothetical protein